MSLSQEVLIRTLMADKMPDQLKLGFALWTRDAVRELTRQRCGFLMPRLHKNSYTLAVANLLEIRPMPEPLGNPFASKLAYKKGLNAARTPG